LKRSAPRPPSLPRRGASWLAALVLCLGCGGEGLPEGEALVPVHRFVDAAMPADDPLSLPLPLATVHDDTRPVLRAPLADTVIFARPVEDPTGNRLLRQRELLPHSLEEAERVLVKTTVRVGSSWVEPPPQVLETRRRKRFSSVELEIPIPANPARQRVQISARAYGLDLVDLENLESEPVEIPPDARLEFAMAVLEPAWGFDPVEFQVRACRGESCETVFTEVFDPAGPEGGRWRDERVSLAPLAGSTRTFRFEAHRLSEAAPFSLPVWANPTIYAPKPRGESRNVILLSIDTLRADHLTSYGYARDTAPFVDERFGRGGTVFDTLVAAATITTPSHASMFTSLSPAVHGTVDGLRVLPRNLPTLAEWIRYRGFDTGAITEDGWLSIRHGFGRGFDTFVENRSADIMDPEGQVDRTFAQARHWLERNHDKRFFLFLHTFQVHTPYAPPARYRKLFTEYDGRPVDETSPSQVRWMSDYDREIRYTDDELRRLFETIDALDLGRDTVFILLSDHGEAFLEHGTLEHGSRLDEEVVRVPLMLWGAGVPAGRRVAAPVSHVDLMPTILDLMKLEIPPGIQGWSLVPLLEGDDGARFATRPIYSESRGTMALGPDRSILPFHPPAFLVRVGDRKLTRYPDADGQPHFEYYDLATDPKEHHNLYEAREQEAHDLFELLDGYEDAGRALRARLDHGESPDSQTVELDPRQEEKLRALGYLR
jgi:arylsulfatase A-like enzyme